MSKRTNRAYSVRENFSALRKYLITKVSLLYLNLFGSRQLTLVRDGGLGDAIMALGVIETLKHKYPDSSFVVNSSFPEIFKEYESTSRSFFAFPVIWLSYSHYDFYPWKTNGPLHCSCMMAKLAGVHKEQKDKVDIAIGLRKHEEFVSNHIVDKKYIVIQSQAANWFKEKNWCRDKWEQLIKWMRNEGHVVYHIGTDENEKLEGVEDFRGKTTVDESLLLIKNAQMFIGINSFGEQAAGSFEIPSIILYGPTNPCYSLNPGQLAVASEFIYSYPQVQQLDYEFYQMEQIEVETVKRAINMINKQA